MARILFAGFAALVLALPASAGELKSGPQAGTKIPGPFAPLNVNGDDAGQKRCLVCKNGDNPVAMVFARTADDPQVQKLIKAIDAATEKNSGCEMGSFVVFCADDDKLEAKLKEWADKEKLKKVILSIDTPTGPSKYNVSKDADLTVVLYNNREVKANYAFKKGEVKDADITAIVSDVSKITPEKK
jgi:hypothetical protein